MAFTREQAYAALASLKPAAVFLDSYRTKRLPEYLDTYFHPPEEFFLAPEWQEAYTHNRLVPILDNGNFDYVIFLDPDSRELVQKCIEEPDETTVYLHWQQYLAALMIRIGEVEDGDERRIRLIADLLGFVHTNELLTYFAQSLGLSNEAWCKAREQFPLNIPSHPTGP